MKNSHCSYVLVWGIAAFILSGCSYWSQIKEQPDSPDNVGDKHAQKSCKPHPAVLAQCRVASEGREVIVAEDFENRFIDHLNQAELFRNVTRGNPDESDRKFVTLQLNIHEQCDYHTGENLSKSFLIGITLGALDPVLPMEIDVESEAQLSVTDWNGNTKMYTSRGKGTAYCNLFARWFTTDRYGVEVKILKRKLEYANFNSLINQLLKDPCPDER